MNHHPTSEPPLAPPLLRLGGHLSLAALAFVIGWWLLDWVRYDLWMFNIYAALFALGGAIRLGKGFVELVKLLWQRREWKKYHSRGAVQKADKTADRDVLKNQGLIR